MGERYNQLSYEERCAIAHLRTEGRSIRQIAATLDRPPPTIARELKRNGAKADGYRAVYAQQQARASSRPLTRPARSRPASRRWCGSLLDRDEELRSKVLERLTWGWSPEQVANRLAREEGEQVISHESIYRFVYAQIARTKDYSWRKLLRRGKWRRGRRRRGGSSSARTILHRRPLSERPAAVADRSEFGHWEADGMQFGRSGQTVLMLHERHSRLLIGVRLPSRAAAPVAEAIAAVLGPLPPEFRQRSPSTTGRSSLTTTNSMPSASRRSSATPTRRGRRAAWRTRLDECAGGCLGRRNWPSSQRRSLQRNSKRTTIRLAGASATGLRPRSS